MRKLLLTLAVLATVAATLSVHAEPPICLTSPSPESRACTVFDIWGYVHYQDGSPAVGAMVSDGGHTMFAEVDGYYDLWILQAGRYSITAGVANIPFCYTHQEVSVSLTSAPIEWGKRADFVLPCSPP